MECRASSVIGSLYRFKYALLSIVNTDDTFELLIANSGGHHGIPPEREIGPLADLGSRTRCSLMISRSK